MGVHGDVICVVWSETCTEERWVWLMDAVREVLAADEGNFIMLMIMEPTAGPPNAKVRSIAAEDFRQLGQRLRKLIAVPMGDGLWLGVVRTVVRGVLLFSGRSDSQEVVSNLAEGLERVRELATSRTPATSLLEGALEQLRAAPG